MADLTYDDLNVGDTIKCVRSDYDHIIKSISHGFRGIEVVPFYGVMPSWIDIDEIISIEKKAKKAKVKKNEKKIKNKELSLKEVIALMKEYKAINSDMEIGVDQMGTIGHPFADGEVVAFALSSNSPTLYPVAEVLDAIESILDYKNKKNNFIQAQKVVFEETLDVEAYIDKRGYPVHEDDAADHENLTALVTKTNAVNLALTQYDLYLQARLTIKKQEDEIRVLKRHLNVNDKSKTHKP